MCSGLLVLSFLKQQRPSIRPADEEQNWPTAVPFRTLPLQSSHTYDYKSLRKKKVGRKQQYSRSSSLAQVTLQKHAVF